MMGLPLPFLQIDGNGIYLMDDPTGMERLVDGLYGP